MHVGLPQPIPPFPFSPILDELALEGISVDELKCSVPPHIIGFELPFIDGTVAEFIYTETFLSSLVKSARIALSIRADLLAPAFWYTCNSLAMIFPPIRKY